MVNHNKQLKFQNFARFVLDNKIWFILILVFGIGIISVLNWFDDETNQVGNNITLTVEVFLAVLIALIAYNQNKQNQKISKFFDNQVEFVREDIGRCLTNIFGSLYSLTDQIEDLQYKKYSEGNLSSNIQTIEFHYLHSTVYLAPYKANALSYLIRQIKRVNEGHPGIHSLLHNIILTLERDFPNKYTQEIEYLIHDFIKKHNEKFPENRSLQNLSLLNFEKKQSFNEFIIEKVYDVKALPDWILTHLEYPGLKDVNSFVPRIKSRIESLHYLKNNNRVRDLKISEIDFLIRVYESAENILKIDYLHELDPVDLRRFINNLKEFVKSYEGYMQDN